MRAEEGEAGNKAAKVSDISFILYISDVRKVSREFSPEIQFQEEDT